MKKQDDINSSMRAILMDWLVEVAEEYKLLPQTLYLTVNYIDRFLSVMSVKRGKLQLVGTACMLLASYHSTHQIPKYVLAPSLFFWVSKFDMHNLNILVLMSLSLSIPLMMMIVSVRTSSFQIKLISQYLSFKGLKTEQFISLN